MIIAYDFTCFKRFLIIFWQQFGYKIGVRRWATPQSAQPTAPLKGKAAAAAAAIESHLIRRKRHLPLKGKAITAAAAIELHLIRRKRHLPLKGKATAAAAAIELHLIRRKRHLPLKGKAMTRSYFRHVSGAKRTSMGKISRRPRNMSKHRTALLIILSPETPMVKVFESMP